MMTEERKLSHSEQQAVAQLESIKEMVAALECDYDRLEELRDERDAYEHLEDHDAPATTPMTQLWAEANPDDAEELKELEEAAGECADADEARERIMEDPLSIEVRSDWYTPGNTDDAEPAEYCILLCTGGPACRIIGELRGGEPHSARLEHQDWGTSWAEWITTGSDHDALLKYAACFCYES